LVEDVLRREVRLPLALLCREASSQRTAVFKLTLESSREALDPVTLFPEFRPDSQSSLAFQPFLTPSASAVSIFVAAKTSARA
jgi:hypothetical protein